MREFTALAVVERTPQRELNVVYLERAPLGHLILAWFSGWAELPRHPNLNGRCHLTVDATGVGVPVVEALRAAQLGTRGITAVTITGGDRARQASGFGVGEHRNVPRTDLLSAVQLPLERGTLKIAKDMRESRTLVRELIRMRTRGTTDRADSGGAEHDDLELAVALDCWQASRPQIGMGTQRLI